MERRLSNPDASDAAQRAACGSRLDAKLIAAGVRVRVPGRAAVERGFWLFPVCFDDETTPSGMSALLDDLLSKHGIDATTGATQLRDVGGSIGEVDEAADDDTLLNMSSIAYVPVPTRSLNYRLPLQLPNSSTGEHRGQVRIGVWCE